MSNKSEMLTHLHEALEKKDGKGALEWIEKLEALEDLDFETRHRCAYERVVAVSYVGEYGDFHKELDRYHRDYRDLFRVARCYNHLTKLLDLPEVYKPYFHMYVEAMEELWWPISVYAMKLEGGADNVAEVFTNRYHSDMEEAFKRSNSRSGALEEVRKAANDDAGRQRLFRALSAAGFLVASYGMLGETVDKAQVEKGWALLKEAEALVETTDIDPLDLTRNLYDQAQLSRLVGDEALSKTLLSRVTALLKEDSRNQKSNESKELAELVDPLYLLAEVCV